MILSPVPDGLSDIGFTEFIVGFAIGIRAFIQADAVFNDEQRKMISVIKNVQDISDAFRPNRQYRIHVGNASMIPFYLNELGRLALIPISLLRNLYEYMQLPHFQLSIDTPRRSIYMLKQKNPRQSRAEALKIFEDSVMDFLTADPLLEMISDR